ncbi:replication initiation protein [Xanthomonas campestris pv. fici]|uniref:rolling circle replication-associated protein n=1 Tax=Xanthomonas euvesicatoria TaxID=456327 RepID=UPI003557BE3C
MSAGTCSFCGDTTVYFFPGGLCVACTGKNARIKLAETLNQQSNELTAFDASIGTMHAAARRSEMAVAKVQQHGFSASAGGRSLGLVHYKTSDTRASTTGTVTIEIDPLQARAQRLRKSVITGARLHDQEAKKGSFRGAWYFLTLTYRDGSDSSPRDVSELFKRMRGHFNRLKSGRARWNRESFRYVWVGELTQRFRPHYHVMLWVPTGMYFGKVDQRGWWPHGTTQIEKARNCVGYLAKYASKFTALTAGAFPKGFRTHGIGGLDTESKRELRWWKAPKDAREALGGEADIRKAKGGWFDRLTGEFWPSPWKVTFIFGRTFAWKVVQL